MLEVIGLFGLYHHVVDFRTEDRVTIIMGANGVGKTVLLQMINALFHARVHELSRIPFTHFSVSLTDGTSITLARSHANGPHPVESGIPLAVTIDLNDATGPATFSVGTTQRGPADERLLSRISQLAPWMQRVAADSWRDTRINRDLTSVEVLEQYGEVFGDESRRRIPKELKERLKKACTGIEVRVIEAQRLLRVPPPARTWHPEVRPDLVHAVKECSAELKDLVKDRLAEYGRESQRLDQTFPQRLLRPSQSSLNVPELKLRMESLRSKRERYVSFGFIDDSQAQPFDLEALDTAPPQQVAVLSLYVQDNESKLSVLDDLAKRVQLLLEKVNTKFRNKTLSFDPENSLCLRGNASTELRLESLSSGEQHELVMLYELLFRANAGTLVLIDEPELSLHIQWQTLFLQDLIEVAQAVNISALVATHSPYIIGERLDLAVSLNPEG